MAKPTKHATPICLGLTALAVIGAVLSLLWASPLPLLILVIPTAIYEIYRTQGESTRWASWVILLVVVLEIIFVAGGISFDLAAFLGQEESSVTGYRVPLGDVTVVGPAALVVLAVILIARTRGVYTKWLAAILGISAFIVVYALDATYFERVLRFALGEGLNYIG